MKIERSYGEYNDRSLQSKKAKESYQPTSVVSRKDNIDLSETTQKIRATQTNDTTNSTRSEKVAALKAAIKNGSYQVSSEEIASSMFKAMNRTEDF
jgi:negative regulator of flagellin synthesis FlgM